MRRILLVLSVAALMAAMMVVMAAPALAQPRDPFDTREPGESGATLHECDFGPDNPAVGHGTLVDPPEQSAPSSGGVGMCDEWPKP